MRIRSLLCRTLIALCLAFPPASATAKPLPQTLPLEDMVGQMIMVGFRGDGGSKETPEMRATLEDIRVGRIGGVILFDRDWQTKKRGRNITSLAQVAELCALLRKDAPIPPFIAVDQEGGRVQRLRPDHGFPPFPTARELGGKNPAETEKTAAAIGKALRRIGINVNFAPVADIAGQPESPAIGALDRAFSRDAAAAAAHAAAFMAGLTRAGVIGSYKHFPGHGSALADSHHAPADITGTWNENELTLYRQLPPNGPFMIMTGHLVHAGFDPRYPASLSEKTITGLLREQLGWQGVVVTDDLEMEAVNLFYPVEERIRLAINAGVDIILFGNNLRHHPEQGRIVHAAIMRLLESGAIRPERIAESWNRIRALKEHIVQ